MTNEITAIQRDKMRYRRIVIKDKLQKIEQLITGRTESYLPLISDNNGRVTKEKTERFIEEMLGSLRRYIGFDPQRTLSDDDVKMYESFLYCALMSLEPERLRRDRDVISWKLPSVFADIIYCAESVDIYGCDSYNRYLEDCYRVYSADCNKRDEFQSCNPGIVYVINPALSETDSDFFIGVKQSLEMLGYPPFIDCLPEKTMLRLRRSCDNTGEPVESDTGEKMEMAAVPVIKEEQHYDYTEYFEGNDHGEFSLDDELADLEARREYEESLPEDVQYALYEESIRSHERQEKIRILDEEIDSLGDDKTYDDNKALDQFTREEIREHEMDRAEDDLLAVKGEWKNRILFDKGTLCENFYRFMWLYFDSPNRKYFVEDIENMVDTFLCEHGMSAFSLGDDYAMINYYVDRTKSRIEKEIARGK